MTAPRSDNSGGWRRGRWGRWRGPIGTALAAAVVLAVLLLPGRLEHLHPLAIVRLPLEGLLVAALLLAWPARAHRSAAAVAAAAGAVLGLLAVLRVLDLSFDVVLGRVFDPVTDGPFLGHALGYVETAAGRPAAAAVLVVAVLLAIAVVAASAAASSRLGRRLRLRRALAARLVGGLAAAWVVAAVAGWAIVPGLPLASRTVAASAADHVQAGVASLRDRAAYRAVLARDPLREVASERLLTGLRGKDVLLVYIESYGRTALEDPGVSAPVRASLADGGRELARAGFGSVAAWLTSPTAGGGSWLAHAAVQSGTWVTSQQRYDELLTSRRLTLTRAFGAAGWSTAAVLPGSVAPWPQGSGYFGFGTMLFREDLDYTGPTFGWASMPDQFVLARLQERLTADSRPVMAQVELVSSHAPWVPLPRMVPWPALGDGSVFDPMPSEGLVEREVWSRASSVRREYGRSVAYSLAAVQSFLARYGTEDTVAVVLGDHQPAAVVTGPGASRDVPVTLLARDPGVLEPLRAAGWVDGPAPGREAPVWRMDEFRDRFLAAYSEPGVVPG